ncbi:MAG TPA: hypothetical protein VJH33_02170 [Candidatus Paceibacterota bacterium]
MKKVLIGLGILALGALAVVTVTSSISEKDAVATALANRVAKETLENETDKYGFICTGLFRGSCKDLLTRAQKNPELAKALLKAKEARVSIFPEWWPWFDAGSVNERGWIEINTLASDEKIIKFLTE